MSIQLKNYSDFMNKKLSTKEVDDFLNTFFAEHYSSLEFEDKSFISKEIDSYEQTNDSCASEAFDQDSSLKDYSYFESENFTSRAA